MPWTRSNLEQMVVLSASGYLSAAGMAVTYVGTNADLSAPIESALRALGYAVATPLSPSDGDIALVPDARLELLAGVTKLFAYRACLGRYTLVDQRAGTDQQALDQLRKAIQSDIEDLEADLLKRYGYGVRRRRHPRMKPIAAGTTWPPPPPPPCSIPPYPPGTRVGPPSPFFNP